MKLNWSAIACCPIQLEEEQFKRLLQKGIWKHWAETLKPEEIVDYRRFYSGKAADIFRSKTSRRYTLHLKDSFYGKLVLEAEDPQVSISALTLVTFQSMSVAYIHYDLTELSNTNSLYEIDKAAFSFFPKSSNHELPVWRSEATGKSYSLNQWLGELLHCPSISSNENTEDWFGNELPRCIYLGTLCTNPLNELLVALASGANPLKKGYEISQEEYQRLDRNRFSVWKNWQCLMNEGKLIFAEINGGATTPLFENLISHQYYFDLFVAVLFQKISLNDFRHKLMADNSNEMNEALQAFRMNYRLNRYSTYPLSHRLYRYFSKSLDLEAEESLVFDEMTHMNESRLRELESRDGRLGGLFSILAALFLPATSIATIVALDDWKMDQTFWGISLGITAILIIASILVWFPFKKR